MAKEFVGEGLFKILKPYCKKEKSCLFHVLQVARIFKGRIIEALGLKVDRVHIYDTVCGDMKNRKSFEEVDICIIYKSKHCNNMINVVGIEEIRRKDYVIAIGGQN